MEEVIDENFIMRNDLRDWLFKENKDGMRYREKIFIAIEKFGIEKWFKAKGYPTDIKSIWKNRYTAKETILEQEMGVVLEQGWLALLLWENFLPKEIWNNKDLFKEYQEKQKTLF